MKMKKTNVKIVTLAMALLLLLAMPFTGFAQYEENRGLFGRGGSSADYSGGESLMRVGEPNTYGTITNDSFGDAPLGSGIAILIVAGAGYAIARRKRSRKNTMLLLACVTLLGFTQCKKEQPLEPTNDGNKTKITLNVDNGGNNGSRVNVTGPDVAFTNGDKILVAYEGKYVGYLEHNGSNFSGNIDATGDNTKPLYFYFLGNCVDVSGLTAGTTTSCTANISDQTGYPAMPVISFSASKEKYNGAGTYTASLHNKASLMKFNVTTPSNSPICITGMNNKVMVDFSKAANDAENNGFTYDKEGDGIIKMKGGSGTNVEKWAIVLPQSELAGSAGSIYAQNGIYTTFTGTRPLIHAIEANQYYHEGDDDVDLAVNTATDVVDLGDVTSSTEIATGKTVIGTLANNVMISIAAGATVTLSGVNINGSGTWNSGKYAGINCLGDATIFLADGTTNSVRGFRSDYPGIHITIGNTLTIQGTGTLNASSNGDGAGIGGGQLISCGHITILSGTVTAIGGDRGAGIGGGDRSSCGDITITNTVTRVTATKGSDAPNSIGAGYGGTCGTVTIGGVEGAISTSPYTYEPPKALSAVTAEDKGKVVGQDGKIYDNASAATSAGTTAVAKIIYIGTTGHATYSHGLALALTDEASTMAWQAAIDACSAKNTSTPVTDATWLLASKDQWDYMLGTNGAGSYTALRDGFSGITGASNLQSDYWSSTKVDQFQAWFYGFVSGHWYDGSKDYSFYVRACLAF